MCSGSLTAGGPKFRLGLLLFLFGRPDRIAYLRQLARDALHLGDDTVERIAEPHVLAQRLEATALAQATERFVGVLVEQLRLLADERLDVVVRDDNRELVRRGLEDELARNGRSRLVFEPTDQRLWCLAGHREIGLQRNPARLDLLREAAQQLARARLDERPGRIQLRRVDERVDRIRPKLRLDLLRDLLEEARLDVAAQLGERLELTCRTRELVVDLGELLLLDLLDGERHRLALLALQLERDLLRVAGVHADDARLDLVDDGSTPELDDVVAARLAVRRDEIDDDGVLRPGGAGFHRPDPRQGP